MSTRDDLTHDRYLRSNSYDSDWVIGNNMGPNALWLTEELTNTLRIEPGMKVLDLGCGRAMSSIFIAKEFEAQVWAADLWISASDNLERIAGAGVQDLVIPVDAEAHSLPFAKGYFDVIVSMDAFHYFGTADLYLGYIVDFLKSGGRIGGHARSRRRTRSDGAGAAGALLGVGLLRLAFACLVAAPLGQDGTRPCRSHVVG